MVFYLQEEGMNVNGQHPWLESVALSCRRVCCAEAQVFERDKQFQCTLKYFQSPVRLRSCSC